MSINHRRHMTRHLHQVQPAAVELPTWDGLRRYSETEARRLAEQLGYEWQGRLRTLSAIHKGRAA